MGFERREKEGEGGGGAGVRECWKKGGVRGVIVNIYSSVALKETLMFRISLNL